jgi:hypothetical protein
MPELCRIFAFLIETSALKGPVNVVSVETMTSGQYFRNLAHSLKRPLFFRIPAFAIRLMLGEMSELVLSGHHVESLQLKKYKFYN